MNKPTKALFVGVLYIALHLTMHTTPAATPPGSAQNEVSNQSGVDPSTSTARDSPSAEATTKVTPHKPEDNSLAAATDGRHDFDFLYGRWKIHNRRLARRLEGCTDWQEFEALQEVRPVLGGLGNVDRFSATFPDGRVVEGMTIRVFDPKAQLWSLYWVDNQSCQLQPPVVGQFDAGVGQFFGNDTFHGKPIRVVFRWKVLSATTAHWEQAFSSDDGRTWETNWEMMMTRDVP